VIKEDIQLNNKNTILYADDQILMATSEDDLQTVAHHLKLIARKHMYVYIYIYIYTYTYSAAR